MDTLVRKAWELYRHTQQFPVATIVNATAWLEERHRKNPTGDLAMVIALHYLILALRHDEGSPLASADECCDRAARWHAAARGSFTVEPVAKAAAEN